jgi:hypothetical protein
VHELDARVEAEIGRGDRQREVARDLRRGLRPDRRLVAEHHAGHVGVPLGEAPEEVLDLEDVALEARAHRVEPRHLLGEELRLGRLDAVDAGRAADHDRPETGKPAAAGEQL